MNHQENTLNNVALLVVDMQEVFIDIIPDLDKIIDRTCFAIEAAQLLGITCLYTEQYPEKLQSTHKNLLAAGLHNATSFSKKAFSALSAPNLITFLKDNNIQHLLLAGVETGICVYQTAIEALHENFDVTILSDCISGRRPDDSRTITASLLQKTNCHLLPSETVFYSVLETADNPKFLDFNTLVKKYS